MKAGDYFDAVTGWANASLRGDERARAARTRLDEAPTPPALALVLTRFGLDARARRVLELAWAVERAFVVAEAARTRGGLTVGLVRHLLDDRGVDAALAPSAPLVRHALCTVGSAGGGLPASDDVVRLGPGLAARLDHDARAAAATADAGAAHAAAPEAKKAHARAAARPAAKSAAKPTAKATAPKAAAKPTKGKAAPPEAAAPDVAARDAAADAADARVAAEHAAAERAADLWWGTVRVSAHTRPAPLPPRLHAVLSALAAGTGLVTVDGCGRRDAHELAPALAHALERAVLVIDGAALALAPSPLALVAAARRDAELDDDVLLICEAAALGEAWRAAAVASSPMTRPLVLLLDAAHAPDPVGVPLALTRLSLLPPPPVAVEPEKKPPPPPAAEPEKKAEAPADDGLGHIRQRAIRDAERALGILREAPRPIPPPGQPIAVAPIQSTTPPSPPPPASPPVARPSAAAAADGPKRSRKGAMYFGGEDAGTPSANSIAGRELDADALPASRPAPAPAAPPPTPAPAATASVPAAAAAPAATDDGLALPVPEDASADVLARIITTSPSPTQRIELIGRLRGVRSNSAVAALRANLGSAHPGVRAAAESVMQAMFGANWNAMRPVPKPVQAPPGDDKDRGPPGGW